MARRPEIAPLAYRDLEEIWAYIARDDAGAADVFIDRLFAGVDSLGQFPQKGSPFPRRPSLRRLVVGSYSIVYQWVKSDDSISVLRVWHNARDPQNFRIRESAPLYSAAVTQPSP